MIIKILGTGCPKCEKIEKNLEKVLKELDLNARVESVGKLKEIVKYGVMTTPALVVDEKVVSVGKALSIKDLKKILKA